MFEKTREIQITRQTKINGEVAAVGKRYVLGENISRFLVNTHKAIFVEGKKPENREADMEITTRKNSEKKR